MGPEIERELVEYLKAQKEADVGATLKRIFDWTQEHSIEDKVRHAEITGALRGHSLRISALEKNDDHIRDELSKSGSWQLEAEHAKLLEERKAGAWWKEKAITIVVGLVMLILGGASTILFHR